VLNDRYIAKWWLVALLVLPWLNPFAPGPSPPITSWLLVLGCLAFVLLGVARVRLADVAATAWLMAALISSLLGLLQYFGVAAVLEPWVNTTALGEAYANLRQRNQFATLLNIGVVAMCWMVMQGTHRQTVLSRAGWMAVAILLGVANAASSSRTGLLQLLLLIVLAYMWGEPRHKPIRHLLALTITAYAVAMLVLPVLVGLDPAEHGMLARLKDHNVDCGSRWVLWHNVLHLIAQKPWLGWGWGELDYAHFVTLYEGPRFCEILDNAHNLPLHLAVELGIPMAVLICGVLGWLMLRAKPWQESDDVRRMAWGVLAVILLHSMLEYPLWYGPFQLAAGCCLWMLWPVPTHSPVQIETKSERRIAAWQRILSISLAAAAAYAAWDYHRISQIYLNPAQRSQAYRDNTLEKISGSWLFRNQVRFAQFTLTPLTRDNAGQLNAMGHDLLHYSPEARVVEKLIESALLLGRDEEALFLIARYRAAFPLDHARSAKER
jgi:O-antigen ligase